MDRGPCGVVTGRTGGGEGRTSPWAPQYLAVHTHPATVQRVLTQARRAAQLVLARRGVDDLDGRVAHRPVDAEVGRLPRLPRFRVADAWKGETDDVTQRPARQVRGTRWAHAGRCHLLLPRNSVCWEAGGRSPNLNPCTATAPPTRPGSRAGTLGRPCTGGEPLSSGSQSRAGCSLVQGAQRWCSARCRATPPPTPCAQDTRTNFFS